MRRILSGRAKKISFAANVLNCLMKTKAFYDYYGLEQPDNSAYYEELPTYMSVSKEAAE